MKNEPIFDWNPNSGIAICILTDGEKNYVGEAVCHPDDEDMMNEKTGCEIAFRRAKIEALRAKRDELKIALKALNQAYYSMNQSKYFNPKSYENRMLRRQIHMTKFDLDTFKEMIASEEQNLRTYIKEKDKFYRHIRHNRQKQG